MGERLRFEREMRDLGLRVDIPYEFQVNSTTTTINPFPTAPYTLTLDKTNAHLNKEMKRLAAIPKLKDMCAAIVDLTDPIKLPYAGLNDDEMLYVASIEKISAMYAAFELRSRVRAHVANAIADGISTRKSHWERTIVKQLETAWKPILNATFPKKLPKGFPKLTEIFTFSNAGEVDFKSTKKKVNLDKRGEFGSVSDLEFLDCMKLMLRWSNNRAADKCIIALSYPYINGSLAGVGLFDAKAKLGMWLSGSYRGNDWKGAAIALTPRWAMLQKRKVSNFTATARQTATLMTLVAKDKLVDAQASQEMRNLLDGASGIGSYVKAALDNDGRASNIIFSKIGYGNDKRSHDCAIVERTVSGKTLRYVVVGLGSEPRDRRELSRLFVELDKCIVSLHEKK